MKTLLEKVTNLREELLTHPYGDNNDRLTKAVVLLTDAVRYLLQRDLEH